MGPTLPRGLVTIAVALVTGCSVDFAECSVQCGSDGSCPRGSSCGSDDFCYAGSARDGVLCSERPIDAAPEPDAADASLIDAGPAVECEGESDPLVLVEEPSITGTTTGATHDFQPSCTAATPPSGNDIVHVLEVPGMLTTLTASTAGSAFDTVLYVKRDSCTAADVACDDDTGGNTSSITISNVSPGTLFVFVDGFSAAQAGSYDLAIAGVVAPGEPCNRALAVAQVILCTSGETCENSGGAGSRCQ
jgi:hypothetical protein